VIQLEVVETVAMKREQTQYDAAISISTSNFEQAKLMQYHFPYEMEKDLTKSMVKRGRESQWDHYQ
jgi:hypothetical protein